MASALVVDTETTATTETVPGAPVANVGSVNGDSAIYIGNGYVLTADHVGEGDFVDGGVYDIDTSTYVRLVDPITRAPTDLILFRLEGTFPNLPDLTLANTSPAAGTALVLTGNGLFRGSGPAPTVYDANYVGFNVSATGQKSTGTTEVSDLGLSTISIGYGPVTVFTSVFAPGGSQVEGGDSGGAAFAPDGAGYELAGLIDAKGTYEVDGDTRPNPAPNGVAVYNDQSDFANIATYAGEIDAITGVPEPSSATISAAIAGVFLLWRLRRRRAAA